MFSVILGVFGPSACSSSTTDDAALGAACDRWITANGFDRAFFGSTGPAPGIVDEIDVRVLSEGDRAVVLSAARTECVGMANAPGSRVDAAFIDGCSAALGAAVASSAASNVPVPAACMPPAGGLADGTQCIDDWQCAGLSCVRSSSDVSGCSVCTQRAAIGGSCYDATCGPQASCVYPFVSPETGQHSNGQCSAASVRRVTEPTCPADQYYVSSAGCVPRLAAGAACSPYETDCGQGLRCIATGTYTYACLSLAPLGGHCAGLDDCVEGATCDGVSLTCVPGPAVGETCTRGCGSRSARCVDHCDGSRVCTDRPAARIAPGVVALDGDTCVTDGATCRTCGALAAEGAACGDAAACVGSTSCVAGVCTKKPALSACRK